MNTHYYKYINLVIRIFIGVGALFYIGYYFRENWITHSNDFKTLQVEWLPLLIALTLVVVNWGLEAYKWQFAIKEVKKISLIEAYKATITGVSAGLVTPNRIGEIPFRALYVAQKDRLTITAKTIVTSFSQLTITIVIGCIGLWNTHEILVPQCNAALLLGLSLALGVLILLFYFNIGHMAKRFQWLKWSLLDRITEAVEAFNWRALSFILFVSLLRYGVFVGQFYLVFQALGISLNSLEHFMLIPVCFLVSSLIPTILLSEMGVRSSVALFIFSAASSAELAIVLASIVLWTINVILPAIVGLPGLKRINIIRK